MHSFLPESVGKERGSEVPLSPLFPKRQFIFLIYFIDYAITVFPFFFSPLSPSTLHTPFYQIPPLGSSPWVIHISSLASPFPIIFLTSPVHFLPIIYASYSLYLFPPFSLLHLPTDNLICDLHFCDSVLVLVVCLVGFCFVI